MATRGCKIRVSQVQRAHKALKVPKGLRGLQEPMVKMARQVRRELMV